MTKTLLRGPDSAQEIYTFLRVSRLSSRNKGQYHRRLSSGDARPTTVNLTPLRALNSVQASPDKAHPLQGLSTPQEMQTLFRVQQTICQVASKPSQGVSDLNEGAKNPTTWDPRCTQSDTY